MSLYSLSIDLCVCLCVYIYICAWRCGGSGRLCRGSLSSLSIDLCVCLCVCIYVPGGVAVVEGCAEGLCLVYL